MSQSLTVLVAEDNEIEVRQIRMLMSKLGHKLLPIAKTAEEALAQYAINIPDVVLLDVRLSGNTDGIELSEKLNAIRPVPVVFLTSNRDKETYERAKKAGAYAFLNKPFDALILERSLDLAFETYVRIKLDKQDTDLVPVAKSLYVRENNVLHKIEYSEINCVEADSIYCHIFTSSRKYTTRLGIGNLETELSNADFLRVHKGWLVQLKKVSQLSLSDNALKVSEMVIPIGRTYKEELVNRLNGKF